MLIHYPCSHLTLAVIVDEDANRIYRDRMTGPADSTDTRCPTCGQPLRHGGHLEAENASLVSKSGNAGITFETQGRCENEACTDFGSEFAPDRWLEPNRGE